MTWHLYLTLSTAMALEFAIRGSWAPVLSARLLGPLGFSGKQAGWIYAMYPLTCIAAPLIAGQMVDRWIATELFLGGAHCASGLALLAAARMTEFRWLFTLIAIHCLFFSPTLGLVNSLTFTHLNNPEVEYFWIRVWSSIAWVLAGWALSIWRRSGKFAFSGSDALMLGAILSFVMAVFCWFCLPHTPPPGGSSWAAAWDPLVALLKKPDVLIFLGISLIVATQLQFYYFGTAKFLEDIGCHHANVPALMTVAQVAETLAVAQVLPFVLPHIGYQWAVAIGPLLWAAMYAAYLVQRPRWMVVASMALHGFAFAFFFDVAIVYLDQIAPPEIRGTVQSLYIMVTLGFGLFVGIHVTGYVMDRCRSEGQYHWRTIFAVPCVVLVLCASAFLAFFIET